jgi:hypothetical protein
LAALTIIILFIKIVENKKKVGYYSQRTKVCKGKHRSFENILLLDTESSKLFYYAAPVQQVKLKGKNATHWEHHKEP